MKLQTAVSIAEDGPWCGTHPPLRPGHGPRPFSSFTLHQPINMSDPQPIPWDLGVVAVGLYGSISLYQASQLLGGAEARQVGAAAERMFDDYCGTVVPSYWIIWILIHWPPPPPPPWLQDIVTATQMLRFSQSLPAGAQQEGMTGAAKKQLTTGLQQFQAQ